MFPWIGKLRNQRNLAYKKSLIAEQKLYLLTNILLRKLKDSFYDQYFLNKSIQLTKENIALVDILEGVAQKRVQVGASSADAIQSQIEINKLHDNVDALRKRELSLAAKIIALLNAPQKSVVAIPGDLFDAKRDISASLGEEELKTSNPTLILLSLQAEKEKTNYRLVRQDRYPDVMVGVDWIDTGRALMPTPDNGKDALVASVSLNIPIWTSTYRSRENAAKSHIVSANEWLVQKCREIFAEYEDIVLKYEDAERRAGLYLDTLLPQAAQALEILIESYKTGKTDFDRVLEGQRALLYFQLEYERAIVDRAKAVNAYDELTGAYR
jgi:outer membrane protein TolC